MAHSNRKIKSIACSRDAIYVPNVTHPAAASLDEPCPGKTLWLLHLLLLVLLLQADASQVLVVYSLRPHAVGWEVFDVVNRA